VASDSWAYLAGDNNWKSAQQLLQNLIECARNGGKYLLDIGPCADGSVTESAVARLRVIGAWLHRNGEAVYATQRCRFPHGSIGVYTRRGNTLYAIVYFWPGETVTVGGVRCKVLSARFLASDRPVQFDQRGSQLMFLSLPEQAPEEPVTVIAVECDAEPVQDALSSKADPGQ
jgi:alpha-L-fucosidase